MLFGVWWHRPVGGSIRHEATLNYNGDVPAADGLSTIGTWLLQCSLPDADPSAAVGVALRNGLFFTTAYFADASSGWGTGGSATIAGDFGLLAKRCCTRSR